MVDVITNPAQIQEFKRDLAALLEKHGATISVVCEPSDCIIISYDESVVFYIGDHQHFSLLTDSCIGPKEILATIGTEALTPDHQR